MRSRDVIFEREMPRAIAAIGGRERYGAKDFRMKWGDLSFAPGFACALILFNVHFSLHLHLCYCNLYLRLPMLQRWHREPFEILESWGVSTCDGSLHLNWGRHTKVVRLPWRDWIQTAHDVRRADGTWAPLAWRSSDPPDRRHVEQHIYHYLLRSGGMQRVIATVHVERRQRKLRRLRWLPFGAKTTYTIGVAFSDEVGERSGSWKGGTLGCAYELHPGETAYACLRRMEQERRFN